MKIYNITNQKDFTAALFAGTVFDNFLVTEASFITAFSVIIDGHLTSAPEEGDDSMTWGTVRPLAYSVVRGRELPKSFKIVLKLSSDNLVSTLNALGMEKDTDISGLYLNIRYEKGELSCTTGCSYSGFTADKSAEAGWDAFAGRFLAKNNIDHEEL